MGLRWTSALSFGVSELDSELEELFRRVDRLLDAMIARDRSEASALIGFLQHYVVAHLVAEERLMEDVAYPGAAAHRAEHAAFAAQVGELSRALASEGATARLVLRLEHVVTGWLHDHVYTSDHALARFVISRRAERADGAAGAGALAGAVARTPRTFAS